MLAAGGRSPSGISAKTWALLVGEAPSSAKLAKAAELGVSTVAAAQFGALLETGDLPFGGDGGTPSAGAGGIPPVGEGGIPG